MFSRAFSFKGRIRRTEYGLSLFVYFLTSILILKTFGSDLRIVLIFFLPLPWFLWAQGAKRCHDIGKSGWWQLIPLYFIALVFEDGDPAPNKYGYSPKYGPRRDEQSATWDVYRKEE